MAKTRPYRPRKKNESSPVDHPDGGTYYLYTLTQHRELAMLEALKDLDYEHDAKGNIVLEKSEPVKRKWADPYERQLARTDVIRQWTIERVEGFVDADKPWLDDEETQPNFIEMTPELLVLYLGEISDHPVEKKRARMSWDVEVSNWVPMMEDGKLLEETYMVAANETYEVWVLTRCRELAHYKEAEAKNSSSTPSDSSAPAEA